MRTQIFSLSAGRRAVTLVEVMIASVLGSMVSIALVTFTIQASRMEKPIFYQQMSLSEGRSAIEAINREIRLATSPLRLVNASGNPDMRGNRVEFAHVGEPPGRRAIYLESDDGDIMTPWDNRLIYDPNTSVPGNERVLARWLSPIEDGVAFTYSGARSPLRVRLRAGDPVGDDADAAESMRSGPGRQGFEINVSVAPRN